MYCVFIAIFQLINNKECLIAKYSILVGKIMCLSYAMQISRAVCEVYGKNILIHSN